MRHTHEVGGALGCRPIATLYPDAPDTIEILARNTSHFLGS